MTQSFDSNAARSNVRYFNAHTEGLGYLDSLVHVTPKPGQDFKSFWTATFCMLEGDPANPEKLRVTLDIPGDNVLDQLMPFLGDINNEQIKVFAGLRLAKFRGKPFKYAEDSQYPGQLGIRYSARLISVLYLKVGDQVVKLKQNEKPTTTDFGVTAAQPAVPVVSSTAKESQLSLHDSVDLFGAPLFVKLAKTDDDFEAKKADLIRSGYRWHGVKSIWIQKAVSLDQLDPMLFDQVWMLGSLGYKSVDGTRLHWVFPFTERKASPSQTRSA